MLTITCPNGISPFRHAEEIPQPGARGGARGAGAARAAHRLPGRATESAPAGPGLGTGGGVRVRACMRVWESARVCALGAPGRTVQLFPLLSFCLLAPSSLSLSPSRCLSHWLVNNKKEGGKRFPKKVDCKEAVPFRPLPQAGLCSAPCSVSLHLLSKSGGMGGTGDGVGGASCFSRILCFFLSAFLTLVQRLR